jgi:hypothetical protein
VSKRKPRRRGTSTPGWIAPLVLLVAAAAAGALLFWPHQRTHEPHGAHRIARATLTPPERAAAAPAETPESATPAARPPASEAPATAPPSPESRTSEPPAAGPGPKLALIVDDCGQWPDVERGFIALPIPVTLSVLPHVHAGATIAQEAAAAGKGVMLHLPMETLSGMYPGPGEVKTSMTDAEIIAQVQDDLAQVPLAQGVNNHEGSKASADERVMRDVMSVLAKHGNLFFIDSRTNAASVGAAQASAAGLPTASRDVFLDNRADVEYSEGQLRAAAAIAKRNGSAIAIGHPRATTLAAVKALIPELQAQGIQFVLVSTLTH